MNGTRAHQRFHARSFKGPSLFVSRLCIQDKIKIMEGRHVGGNLRDPKIKEKGITRNTTGRTPNMFCRQNQISFLPSTGKNERRYIVQILLSAQNPVITWIDMCGPIISFYLKTSHM